MLKKSFSKGLKGKILAVVTIAFASSLTSAMLNVSLDIGDKVNKELKTYGANIIVEPRVDTIPVNIGGVDFNPLSKGTFIEEESLGKIKTIFWANNIVAFAPYLEQAGKVNGTPINMVGTWFDKQITAPTGEKPVTGIKSLKSWWRIDGAWPSDSASDEAIVGIQLAKQSGLKPGDQLRVEVTTPNGPKEQIFKVKGTFDSGGSDDDKIFVPLSVVQKAQGLEGKVAKVDVSALTTPDNELARRAAKDPAALSTRDYETWYCTAYVSSISYQIEEVLPGAKANAIRQVSDSEGVILGKIQLLMLLLTVAALISSALGISSLMTTKVLERSKEIGLLKALGAEGRQVILLFLSETLVSALLGGLLGYLLGLGFAQIIGKTVFGSVLSVKLMVLPLVLTISVGVALLGSLTAIRMLAKLRPAEVLHGR